MSMALLPSYWYVLGSQSGIWDTPLSAQARAHRAGTPCCAESWGNEELVPCMLQRRTHWGCATLIRERETAGWLPNTLVCPLKQGSHLLMKHRCRLSKLQVFAYVHFMQKACGRKIWRKQQTDAGTEISELPAADCGCAPCECASVLYFTKDLFLPRVLQIHRANWVGKGTR